MLHEHMHSLQTSFNSHHSLFGPFAILLSRMVPFIRVYLLEVAPYRLVNCISVETELPVLVARASFSEIFTAMFMHYGSSA